MSPAIDTDADSVREALKSVIDPEVGIDIVELGLVYGIEVDATRVLVTLTMTSPACPLGELIQSQAEQVVREALPGRTVEIALAWQPPWTPERMSATARQKLGLGE